MCVGKTTIGRPLAKDLGLQFYDLDWYIEDRFRKKIPQIFAEEGEAYFRDLEQRMLHEVANFENIVLACGGGTPCFFDNMDYMNQVGTTVYLKASPTTICQHLKMSKGQRPLLANKSEQEVADFVHEQLMQRVPYYEKAHHIIDVDLLDTYNKIDDIVAVIRQQLAI